MQILMALMYAMWFTVPWALNETLHSYVLQIGTIFGFAYLIMLVITMTLQTGHILYIIKQNEDSSMTDQHGNYMMATLSNPFEGFDNVFKSIWVVFLAITFWNRLKIQVMDQALQLTLCSQYVRSLVLAEPPAVSLFVSDPPKPLEFLKLLFSRPRTALAIIKFGAKGLEPARKAARKSDMEEAMNLFGRAALGPEKAEHMSEERKKQALVNLTKAEFLGSGFLPLEDQKLRNIEVPTLLLTGQLSPIVFYYLTNRLEELIPNTDRIEISAASHIMHEDNASAFNAALLSFLTGHRKSA